MRIEPFERPHGLTMQAVFWFMKRKFGKVVTPMKVVMRMSSICSIADRRSPSGKALRTANDRRSA